MFKLFLERVPPEVKLSTTGPGETEAIPVNTATFLVDKFQHVAHLNNSELFQNLSSLVEHLTDTQQFDMCQLLQSYPELFTDVPKQIQHDIDVAGAKPIKQYAYRANPEKRRSLDKEVKYLFEHGFAKHSCSPWSSPCILVPKPEMVLSVSVKIFANSVTVPDSYPMPRMDDCVDHVGAATFVTKLDLLKGCWQVPLTQCASEISADTRLFCTVYGNGIWNA